MDLPFLDPLRTILSTSARQVGGQFAITLATLALALVALGLAVAAGLVALSGVIGFPAAALAFAGGFALLALGVFRLGQVQAARRNQQIALASTRAASDVALAVTFVRSATALLPLVGLAAGLTMAWRRRPTR